ncbi:hypothetical protein PENSPDRAFT_648431 [Peniophora sp. CONT]|nr:hypothetical protein PENSPDRAFT_648431 [Peniophora sp. CONT]
MSIPEQTKADLRWRQLMVSDHAIGGSDQRQYQRKLAQRVSYRHELCLAWEKPGPGACRNRSDP